MDVHSSYLSRNSPMKHRWHKFWRKTEPCLLKIIPDSNWWIHLLLYLAHINCCVHATVCVEKEMCTSKEQPEINAGPSRARSDQIQIWSICWLRRLKSASCWSLKTRSGQDCLWLLVWACIAKCSIIQNNKMKPLCIEKQHSSLDCLVFPRLSWNSLPWCSGFLHGGETAGQPRRQVCLMFWVQFHTDHCLN